VEHDVEETKFGGSTSSTEQEESESNEVSCHLESCRDRPWREVGYENP
jgi:hypothetical protein